MADNDHFVEVRYSNDGGHNWQNWKRRSIGKTGEYEQRVKIHRLGRFRQRVFEIKVSSPRQSDLLAAVVNFEPTDD
ncbi:hypothetical protein LRM36_05165 [Stenotrophomonas maltophilia]|nr:hypothetical protein [Stenotrophomonas maltophilia]